MSYLDSFHITNTLTSCDVYNERGYRGNSVTAGKFRCTRKDRVEPFYIKPSWRTSHAVKVIAGPLVTTRTKGETAAAKERKSVCDYVRSIRAVASCRPAFLGLSNRLGLAPLRFPSGRVDAILRSRSESFESRLVYAIAYVSITRAMHSRVYLEGKQRERGLSGAPRLLLPFFLSEYESTVGIPLSLSFRWSVRPLILACVSGSLLGRKEDGRTDGQTKEHRSSAPCMWRFSFQKLACTREMRTDRGLRAIKASANIAANCAFQHGERNVFIKLVIILNIAQVFEPNSSVFWKLTLAK